MGLRRYLAVAADEQLALGRVDTVARERVDFDLLYSQSMSARFPRTGGSDTQHL